MVDLEPQPQSGGRDLDPRVERSRRVILGAALDLLGEIGFGGVTIEAVAARAGVGKSTIYRHWPGKLELIEDAICTLKARLAPPAGETTRDRVIHVLRQAASNVADAPWSTCLPAIIDAAQRDPEVKVIHRRLSLERRQFLIDVLADGVARGEISSDRDLALVADCLFGPIVVRRLLLHEPLDPENVPALVDEVLRG
ncbi:MAG: TetR/AcrR family transcriptional regulator [Actinomycetota bacterium]|nr:TetR/AcrR family transcriptional regulator [Actinomycetota bacterium]